MTGIAPSLYAQNILQLHAQLRETGASPDDQQYLSRAHRLASELFSGQSRASDKPFLEHLVATASILVACRAPLPVAAAGLLHAAYEAGDFGVGLLRRHADKRAEVARRVGAEAEDYLERYFRLHWTGDRIQSLAARAGSLPPREQHIVLMRLANELEEHTDCGIQFCANAEQRLARMRSLGPHLTNIARAIGQVDLASELCRAMEENDKAVIPAALRGASSFSSVRPPRSYTRRWTARMRSSMSRILAG